MITTFINKLEDKSGCEVLDLPHMFSSYLWKLFHIWSLLSSTNDFHVSESWHIDEKLYQEKIVNDSNKTGAIRKDFFDYFSVSLLMACYNLLWWQYVSVWK